MMDTTTAENVGNDVRDAAQKGYDDAMKAACASVRSATDKVTAAARDAADAIHARGREVARHVAKQGGEHVKTMREGIVARPVESAVIALAVGLVAGWLLTRGSD